MPKLSNTAFLALVVPAVALVIAAAADSAHPAPKPPLGLGKIAACGRDAEPWLLARAAMQGPLRSNGMEPIGFVSHRRDAKAERGVKCAALAKLIDGRSAWVTYGWDVDANAVPPREWTYLAPTFSVLPPF